MDPIVIILLGGAAVYLIFRLSSSHRKIRSSEDRTEKIQQELARLRKKRDED